VCDRSVQYILRGQYGAALQQLAGVGSKGQSTAEVENLRGLATLLSGDPAKALASFDRALALSPSLAEARFNRAVALLRTGDAARASAELEALWKDETTPLRATAAFHNGLALDALKRPADAEKWLLRALQADASLTSALLYVGMLRERRGDLQGAGRAYIDYLKHEPDSVAAALRLGISAQRAGRTDVARQYLQRVIRKAPDSNEATEARKHLVLWE
jgi:tetratricopeptide (TPR) repeat protein